MTAPLPPEFTSGFSSGFDARMAAEGPPAIFVRTFDGEWRLSADLTRDGYQHSAPAPHRDPAFVLFRDRTTGFVSLFYTTGRALLTDHPRAEVRLYVTEREASAALEALGRPPVIEAFPS